MPDNRDYTRYSFRITILVIAVLLVVSIIPPFSIGKINFRRANILSDIIVFVDDTAVREGELTDLDKQFVEESRNMDSLNVDHSAAEQLAEQLAGQVWDFGTVPEIDTGHSYSDEDMQADVEAGKIVPIEDFGGGNGPGIADFSKMMPEASRNRVVRIAFLGDSYIEGDLITADVREQLQGLYGGYGVGFVPFGNPLAINRPTVTHTFEGWTNYNLINKKSVPEEYRERFFVSGAVNIPSEGAWAKFMGTGFRKRISSWSKARLLFVNDGGSEINLEVNDSITRRFTPDPGVAVQQITITGNGMKSLKVTVDNAGGFVGYGVSLESPRGVIVDNYAIRSNSGIALFGTDAVTNARIGRMLGYDLVVLQYGLNAMNADVTDYSAYGQQFRRVINYVKSCFPGSVIVVMGVGDRATQRDGQFLTMNAVPAMIAEQKAAAEACGVAFWDTFRAMGGHNSMSKFVEWNWAAKDYTHLSYGGGRYLATEFVKALRYAKNGAGSGSNGSDFGGSSRYNYGGGDISLDLSAPATPGGQSDSTGHAVSDSTGTVAPDVTVEVGSRGIVDDSVGTGDPVSGGAGSSSAGRSTGGAADSLLSGRAADMAKQRHDSTAMSGSENMAGTGKTGYVDRYGAYSLTIGR